MTEQELRDTLIALIGYREDIDNLNLDNAHVRSFSDAGVMTSNEGIVIRTEDGSEFQLTIVQSR